MTHELLRHIASSRLPLSFYRKEDMDQVRTLRDQGLVIALIPAPADPLSMSGPAEAAQVLALTREGRATAQRGIHKPLPAPPRASRFRSEIAPVRGRRSRAGIYAAL